MGISLLAACHCTSTLVFVLCYFTRQIKALLLLRLLEMGGAAESNIHAPPHIAERGRFVLKG